MIGLLDELGILNGTDKGSLTHGYLTHYGRILHPLRDDPITLLEIGVSDGASLRMWAEYFQRATVVGVDINAECRKHAGGRRIVEIGSQVDPEFLAGFRAKYSPHIIVDDGSHRADHIMATFQQMYPSLRAGGFYIVEDVQFHAGPWAHQWRDDATISPQAFFLALANLVVCPSDSVEFDAALARATDSVEFAHGVIVVRKRPEPEPDGMAQRRALVERAEKPDTWGMLTSYMLANGGAPADAVVAAQKAIDLGSTSLGAHHLLSIALERAGDIAAAIEAEREAVRLHPGTPLFATRLAELETLNVLVRERASHLARERA